MKQAASNGFQSLFFFWMFVCLLTSALCGFVWEEYYYILVEWIMCICIKITKIWDNTSFKLQNGVSLVWSILKVPILQKSGPTHFLNDGGNNKICNTAKRQGNSIGKSTFSEWLHFHSLTLPLVTFQHQACGGDVRLSLF